MLWSGTGITAGSSFEFLPLIDATYPPYTAIKVILDNHSAHISKETKAWLAKQAAGRSNSPSRPSTVRG